MSSLKSFRQTHSLFSLFTGRRSSLERGSKLDSFRSKTKETIIEPLPTTSSKSLDNFRALTIVVNHLYRQEADKLKDEDLYKFLADFRRPTGSALSNKRLKNIPVTIRLEISPCNSEVENCLTPELVPVIPQNPEQPRPVKEILDFPAKPAMRAHVSYRNLLYVYPKSVNFTNRLGMSARNVACKVSTSWIVFI